MSEIYLNLNFEIELVASLLNFNYDF